jgi:L-threonylcarbamoyladenylate synthase
MTRYTKLNVIDAVDCLQDGKLIAYPTEAVYGLGCDPYNETAIHQLLELKGRQSKAGFVLIASRFSQLEPWITKLDQELIDRAMQTWPGPVTWLFPRAAHVSDYVAGTHPTIALRITAHQPSRELCEAFGSALISTSANPSADKPARSALEVADYFGDRIAGILDGELGHSKNPSEIRDLVSGSIIRAG